MNDVFEKAQEVAKTLGAPLPGTVPQLVTRNDIPPVAEKLVEWVQRLLEEKEAEKLAHADSRSARLFLETTLKIYDAVTAGMVFKGKKEEHELAMRRTNDILNAGVDAWREMGSQ